MLWLELGFRIRVVLKCKYRYVGVHIYHPLRIRVRVGVLEIVGAARPAAGKYYVMIYCCI